MVLPILYTLSYFTKVRTCGECALFIMKIAFSDLKVAEEDSKWTADAIAAGNCSQINSTRCVAKPSVSPPGAQPRQR